jgi:hypothetical protein
MRILPFLLAALLVAGCLGLGGSKRPDYEGAQEAVNASVSPILDPTHDHLDASLHQGSLNVELVGYHSGVPGNGQDPGAIPAGVTYNEFAVTDEYAYLARSSLDGSVGGFVILSHKDAANPGALSYVGEFPALGGADLEVSTDETLAFFDTQRSGSSGSSPVSPAFGPYDPAPIIASATGSQTPGSALPRGVLVVDISDKRAPQLESYASLPVNGPHTITYWQDPEDGAEYLIVCTYDLVRDAQTGAITGTVPATQRVLIYQVQRAPATPLPTQPPMPTTLVLLTQYSLTDAAPEGKLYFPHDTRVQVHPSFGGGGVALLYVAYWDKGVQILDFSDPSSPQPVGFFTEFGPTSFNNVHLAQPFDDPVDGRHVTVAQPEIPAAPDETGQITFLDTTDPEHPTQLGYWTLPNGTAGRLGINGFDFSPHNFDTWDGKVALAHFHGGVWVIDASDDQNLQDPKTVGYYMPAKPRAGSPVAQPNVWGVFEHGGLLWASDEATGLYVLRYTGP